MTATSSLVFMLLLCFAQIRIVFGFADWMTKDFCHRSMSVGDVIMNSEVLLSDDRSVLVFRGEEQLSSGDMYIPGETLEVRVSDKKPQFVFEVIGPESAQFTNGGCDGTRIANKPSVQLNLPTDDVSSDNVTLHVAWALGHSTVYLSHDFTLVPKPSVVSASSRDTEEASIDAINQNHEELDATSIHKRPSLKRETGKKHIQLEEEEMISLPPSSTDALDRPVLSHSTNNYSIASMHNHLSSAVSGFLSSWNSSASSLLSSTTSLYNRKDTGLSSLSSLSSSSHHRRHNQSFVSRTGKLLTALEKAALEELAVVSAESASRLRGSSSSSSSRSSSSKKKSKTAKKTKLKYKQSASKTDAIPVVAAKSALDQKTLSEEDRLTLNMQEREKQQLNAQLEAEKAEAEHGKSSEKVSGKNGQQQEKEEKEQVIDDQKKGLGLRGSAVDNTKEFQQKQPTSQERVQSNGLSMQQRKQAKVIELKRERDRRRHRHDRHEDIEEEKEEESEDGEEKDPNDGDRHEEEEEDDEEEQEEQEEEIRAGEESKHGIDRSAHQARSSAASTSSSSPRLHKHKNDAHSQHSHPWLRLIVRMLLVLGLMFASTIFCGSCCAIWHSRFAMWKQIQRRLGRRMNEE